MVRWAREGERVTTLDGQERTLPARIGVVAGPRRRRWPWPGSWAAPRARSRDGTTRGRARGRLLGRRSPSAARRKALGMHTEASHRFERGADPEAPAAAPRPASRTWLAKIGAGHVRPGLIETLGRRRARGARAACARRASTRCWACRSPPTSAQRDPDAASASACRAGAGRHSRRRGPPWRGDVSREVDLIEEVARHYGLGQDPVDDPARPRASEGCVPRRRASARVRDGAGGGGPHRGHQLRVRRRAPADRPSCRRPWRLANPLSVGPGPAAHVARAARACVDDARGRTCARAGRDVALFEIGPGVRAARDARDLPAGGAAARASCLAGAAQPAPLVGARDGRGLLRRQGLRRAPGPRPRRPRRHGERRRSDAAALSFTPAGRLRSATAGRARLRGGAPSRPPRRARS